MAVILLGGGLLEGLALAWAGKGLVAVLAGLRIVTPIRGAVIHGASAVLVVLNAVRVVEWRPTAVS